MSVNLTMDGNTYQDAQKIVVGGKEIGIAEVGTMTGIMNKGSFVLNERTQGQDVIINHNLGVIPQIVIIEAPNYDSEVSAQNSDMVYGIYNSVYASFAPNDAIMVSGYYGSASSTDVSFTTMNAGNAGRGQFESALSATQFCGIAYNSNYRYAVGVTYNWIAIGGLNVS